jgi:hypothetical protein
MKPSLDEQVKREFIEYVGVPMQPGEVTIGVKEDGTPITRPFDLVSEDETIVASIQTSCLHLKSRPGQKAYGSLYRVLGAILYLHLCTKCRERYLIMSDRDMFDEITEDFSSIFKDINMLFWDDVKK